MMYINNIAFALAALSAVSALGINESDVPSVCATICKPLVQLSDACSSSSSTDSSCICKNTSFDVVNLGSMCAICCQQANSLGDDLKSISSACGFTQGTYNQASASSVAATVVVTATYSGKTTTLSAAATASATSSSASSSKNVAPAPTMQAAGLLAGAGAVAAGLIL
ncbi:uncharacterized protein PV09_00249 [Verruconis gallopava]|uniref:Extracellular membrane protein CFEM domain-containing protein n=1 Tax=Verruconis gallopava TaxID=253628 RepID=A0A0D2ARM3_9PEZI|nr:uncharacterized protein PV09_00249 [Verruconis gallopava]KIW09348.1 hypothetical protein PV09_00249 [Verruconis gallopava]